VTHGHRLTAALAVAALLFAGCGSASQLRASPAASTPTSLATSVATATASWAVIVMGGPAGRHEDFWQLLIRRAGTHTWRPATPPGVASNGGLVAAPAGRQSLVVGFRPSQGLSFSPLATTTDNGASWSAGLLDARLAGLLGALAAAPGGGRLLAVLANGSTELSADGGAHWSRLATLRSLAASAPGRRCGLGSLTAAAFSTAHAPLLAGACARPGTVGLFAFADGAWRLAGPALPGSLAASPARPIGLSVAGPLETLLLMAGTGRGAVLLAAWSTGGRRWAFSPSLPLAGAQVRSVSAGPGGELGVTLDRRGGVTLAGPGASWRWLPLLPPGSQTLSPGPGGRVDALAAAGTTFSDWEWAPGSGVWAKTQVLRVPIQYRSS
jgi:hypothetical protein